MTYSASTIQAYQTSVATARANISTEVADLNAAQTAEKSAESALATAQSQLSLAQAPATATDIEAQQAQVAAAQAAVDVAQAQLDKASIIAPISGTITNNDAHVGSTASVGTSLISMISDTKFQMDTYVSQADLAKIKGGDTAQVQLDAYENDAPFAAHVARIDPAATLQNGVSAYKVTLQFDADDPRIAAGLTGTAAIETQSQASAVVIPTSAVIRRGDAYFVMKHDASGDVLTPISVGISNPSGMTEITSGLSEGDMVQSFGAQQ